MSRSRQHKRRHKKPAGPPAPAATGSREFTASRRSKMQDPAGGSWFQNKRPVLHFVLLLAGLMIAFNASFYLYLSKSAMFDAYLGINAEVSAAVIRALGDDAKASGTSVSSSRYSVSIKTGCDAIQASAFYVFIVTASPAAVSLLRRLPSLLIGTLTLLILNLVRIVSLYYTGVYFPKAFDVMHVEVWQPIFIFLPLAFWFVWLRRVMRNTAVDSNVSD